MRSEYQIFLRILSYFLHILGDLRNFVAFLLRTMEFLKNTSVILPYSENAFFKVETATDKASSPIGAIPKRLAKPWMAPGYA